MKKGKSIDISQLLRFLPSDLQIEISENIFRKGYNPEEKALAQWELKDKLESVVRRGPKKKLGSVSGETLHETRVGRALEVVGGLFEESGVTVFRRLTVFEAARRDPERFAGIW